MPETSSNTPRSVVTPALAQTEPLALEPPEQGKANWPRRFVFLGGEVEIGRKTCKRLGQSVSFTEAEWDDVRRCAPFLPEDEFAEFGFDKALVRKYGDVSNIAAAPQEMRNKIAAAKRRFVERHHLREPLPVKSEM